MEQSHVHPVVWSEPPSDNLVSYCHAIGGPMRDSFTINPGVLAVTVVTSWEKGFWHRTQYQTAPFLVSRIR